MSGQGREMPTDHVASAPRDTGVSMHGKLAHFVTIMVYVLVAGVMWGTWLSLGRRMVLVT
jgi:hypothetical protein